MSDQVSFVFYTERRLVELTGLKAANLSELRRLIAKVHGSAIFYHTHHRFLSQHWVTPVIYNEFATWVIDVLQEPELGEKLAAIDILAFTSIRQLREKILSTLDETLRVSGKKARDCPPGQEFHFCQSKSFVMRTGLEARDVSDFFKCLKHVSNVSLYFHLIEARLRLERESNDFSTWLESRGEKQLAETINQLDPYASNLDELRERMIAMTPRTQGASA